jgi:hypothetical protein
LLPFGWGAIAAFIFGFLSATLGMKIAWYIAPIAGLIGKKGGNIGHDLTVPFCGVAFPVFRWLEMRWTGKQSIGMPLNDVDCYTGSVLLEDLPDSGTFTMLCSVQAVGFQTANPDVGGGYVLYRQADSQLSRLQVLQTASRRPIGASTRSPGHQSG